MVWIIFPTLHFTSLPSWFVNVMLNWPLLACCIFKLRSITFNIFQYITRLLESFIILLVSRAWQDGNWRCDHCGALVVEWSEDPCGGFGSYRRWTMKSNPCWIVVAPASPNFNVAFGLRAWGRWTKKSNPNAEETILALCNVEIWGLGVYLVGVCRVRSFCPSTVSCLYFLLTKVFLLI